jgi:hypothetical protein
LSRPPQQANRSLSTRQRQSRDSRVRHGCLPEGPTCSCIHRRAHPSPTR